LVLLMLCLIVQPVIASQGAMHEALGHPDASLNHSDLHAVQPQAEAADPDGESSVSHQLMHHAHCCAQPQIPASAYWRLPAFARVATTHWTFDNLVVSDAYPASPFRPPILA
jgi:hypothetical protein